MIRLLVFLACLLPGLARAEEIVLGLSQDEVAITATFTGSELLIYGAVKRDGTEVNTQGLGVVIAVAGPNEPVTVRRKERVAGMWINTESLPVDVAPSFYAIATTGPLGGLLDEIDDTKWGITQSRVIRSTVQSDVDTQTFLAAFTRLKQDAGLYLLLEGAVDLTADTLFATRIKLPSNIIEGDYRARILLTRDGRVVDHYDTTIPVRKVGVERWLFMLANEQAAIYGLLSLVIAAMAGWAASAIFAAFRR